MKQGEEPLIVKCEPVEDNMMKWVVHMKFDAESALQMSLVQYAEHLMDPSRERIVLQVRFPPSYPMTAPEFWVQQPRLKSMRGLPVTFNGRVCSPMLTTENWNPSLRVSQVLEALRLTMVDAGAVVDRSVAMVDVDASYLEPPPALHRTATDTVATANDFYKPELRCVSSTWFQGLSLEDGDRIGLPHAYAQEIFSRPRFESPLLFEVKTTTGMRRYCGLYDFVAGLDPGLCLLPSWLLESMHLQDGDQVRVRCVSLPLIDFVRIQPHTCGFYTAVRESGGDAKSLLTRSLQRLTALTEDTPVPIEVAGRDYMVQVEELRPAGAVRIIDTDVENYFAFEVDFDPAPDLEDAGKLQERDDFLKARVRARIAEERERKTTAARELAEAKRRRFRELQAHCLAACRASTGDIECGLRFPDGSKLSARFSEGTPVVALAALVLQSHWAEETMPWDIVLSVAPERRVLGLGDLISKDLHRCAILVQEERAPEDPEKILSLCGLEVPPVLERKRSNEVAQDVVPTPDFVDDVEAQLRTERFFEIQRYIDGGLDRAEAERRVMAGQRATATEAERRVAFRPAHRRRREMFADPSPASPVSPDSSNPDQQAAELAEKLARVVAFTARTEDEARVALVQHDWSVEQAVDSLLAPAPVCTVEAEGDSDRPEVETVMAFTGVDHATALCLLRASGWDTQQAINAQLG